MSYPRMSMIAQSLYSAPIQDIPAAVRSEIGKLQLRGTLPRGSRIAIACGSRGIANIALITRIVAEEMQLLGWDPFLVPAMGSHGGATAEGQVEVLASYGLTEDYAGAPILSSMDVVQIGVLPQGMPVYLDRHASEADATIVINRIKKHTDFTGPVESGLMKIMVAGLGNHLGATAIHDWGARGLREFLVPAARMIIERAPVLFGVGVLDDGLEQTSEIHAIPAAEIEKTEMALLVKANSYMARLPLDDIDLLLVDRMGKEISGIGMDTNVIGRIGIRGEPEFACPRVKWLIVFDLTTASFGNASGLGLADFTVQRVVNKIDFDAWRANAITSGFPERGKVPLTLATDKEAVDLGLRLLAGTRPEDARVVRVWDTLHLSRMQVSESLIAELKHKDGIEVLTEPGELGFTPDGSLQPVDWAAWMA